MMTHVALAIGVATIGSVFFSYLEDAPTQLSYVAALCAALICNLVLQIATILLLALSPRGWRAGAPILNI